MPFKYKQTIEEMTDSNQLFYSLISDLKAKIYDARRRVAFSLNSQLIELYWVLGKEIDKKLQKQWGNNAIERIAVELRTEFPDMKGFSRRNLYAIRQWYTFYSEHYEFVPQAVAQIPWGHHRLIIAKIKQVDIAMFYCDETLKNSWDRDTLEIKIKSDFHSKLRTVPNNFEKTLSQNQFKLATNILKDPYNFDFLGLQEDALEKSIEDEIAKNITKFLIELGKGFAFVGRQYKIEVDDTDYFIDMLFYHLELRCFVVVELKSGKFKPEFAGKLNFYLSAVDSMLKKQNDNPSIGILLCKNKNKIEVEYSLRDLNKPIGISEYHLVNAMPENIKSNFPSIEELENRLIDDN